MDLEVGDKVSLIIEAETHLGFSVLIDVCYIEMRFFRS